MQVPAKYLKGARPVRAADLESFLPNIPNQELQKTFGKFRFKAEAFKKSTYVDE